MARIINRNPFEMPVSFSESEMSQIYDAAAARQKPKDDNLHLVRDKRIIDRDNVKTHVIGLLGEFAVAKILDGTVDTKAYLAGDSQKDLVLYGVSAEIKTLQGYLAFRNLADFRADVAVLVIYERDDFATVSVQGWITRHDFQNDHFIDDFGYGPRPCIQPAALCPIVSLKAYCIMLRNLRWIRKAQRSKVTA